jgi:Predicted integral membrane protein (DUF2189)
MTGGSDPLTIRFGWHREPARPRHPVRRLNERPNERMIRLIAVAPLLFEPRTVGQQLPRFAMVGPNLHSNAETSRARPGVELRWPASAIWRPGEPAVHTIALEDLRDAVAKGIEDFKTIPSHAIYLCIIYPLIGLLLFRFLFGYEMLPLVYPTIAGFTLIGPVGALGLYELSRRREKGLDVDAHLSRYSSLGWAWLRSCTCKLLAARCQHHLKTLCARCLLPRQVSN